MVTARRKKGGAITDLNGYRGIHCVVFLLKWYSQCILRRMAPHAPLPKEQRGFVSGGNCAQAALALHTTIRHQLEQGSIACAAFIDLEKAFPSVVRVILWWRLYKLGLHKTTLRALIALYENTSATVRGTDGYCALFLIHTGTKEGCVLSPLLFALFLFDVPQVMKARLENSGYQCLLCFVLMYADDLVLNAGSTSELRELLDSWQTYCSELHLITNTKKTKIVIFRNKTNPHYQWINGVLHFVAVATDIESAVRIEFLYDGSPLEIVEAFVYLGIYFHEYGSLYDMAKFSVDRALKAHNALIAALFGAPHLPPHRIHELWFSIVGSIALYGSEIWGIITCKDLQDLWRSFRNWFSGVDKRTLSERLDCWLGGTPLQETARSMACRFMIEAAVSSRDDFTGSLITMQRSLAEENTWLKKTSHMIKNIWRGLTIEHGEFQTVASYDPNLISNSLGSIVRLSVAFRNQCGTHCVSWVIKTFRKDIMNTYSQIHTSAAQVKIRNKNANEAQPQYKQDYFLSILLGEEESPWDLKLFENVDVRSFRRFCKFITGQFGVARVHGHYQNRSLFGFIQHTDVKRCCFFCALFHKTLVLDSEWHMVFACPIAQNKRSILKSQLGILGVSWNYWHMQPSPSLLAELLNKIRVYPAGIEEFCIFLLHIQYARDKVYKNVEVNTSQAFFYSMPGTIEVARSLSTNINNRNYNHIQDVFAPTYLQ